MGRAEELKQSCFAKPVELNTLSVADNIEFFPYVSEFMEDLFCSFSDTTTFSGLEGKENFLPELAFILVASGFHD